MCGRSSISKKESDLEKRFNARFYSENIEKYNPLPNYNVCPTTYVPILTQEKPQQFQYYHWGIELESHTGKVFKNIINARKENLLHIPTFHESLQMRRCLLPATSYFEWKTLHQGKTKIPYLVQLKSNPIFSIAGLWINQLDAHGELIPKFVLITQEPTKNLSTIHDRMPAILSPENEQKWLDTTISSKDALHCIVSSSDEEFVFHPVTNELNRSFENHPKFLVETQYQIPEQGSLF